MLPVSDIDDRLRRLRRQMSGAFLVWTLLVGLSLAWNLHNVREQILTLAAREARVHFDKDRAFRFWASRHGGVYVKVDERTRPNPNLAHIDLRDLDLADGTTLTLMNPAFMMRQLMEEYSDAYGVRGRITSLKPTHSGNAPDSWEVMALKRFELGESEVFELSHQEGGDFLRLMRPMMVEEHCLKCHSHQNYMVGDVRGGVGVSVPLAPFEESTSASFRVQIGSHGAIWVVGLAGLLAAGRHARRAAVKDEAEERKVRILSHERRLILDSVGEGIVELDAAGSIGFINAAALSMLGWTGRDVLGHDFHDLVHTGDRQDCPVLHAMSMGQPASMAGERFKRADDTDFPVEIAVAPILDDGQRSGGVVLFRDISARQEHEHEARRLMDQLARSNEDLQHFAYVISHDLQEPLRMVSSYLALIERRYAPALDEEGHEFIGYAVDGAKRMSRMISDMLEFSRVDTKGNVFQKVAVEDVVAEAMNNLKVAIDEAGAEIVVEGSLPDVTADRTQLVRVFQNLIGNAVKFRHPDRAPRVVISASHEPDGCWRFTVADNGIGMAEQGSDRIFQIFQRLHSRDAYEGTGIGLAVVKRIVERHNGRIWFESVLGAGSAFHLTIPSGAAAKSR